MWEYNVVHPCKNIPKHVVVVCTKSVKDYHTEGGFYIMEGPNQRPNSFVAPDDRRKTP